MDIRRIKDGDRDTIKKWLSDINWEGITSELLPSTTFMVEDGGIPVVSSHYYAHSECPIAFMGITIANPEYKGNKEEHIKLLLNTMEESMRNEGCVLCYYATDIHSEWFINKYMKPRGFVFSPGFSGAKPLIKEQSVDFIV